MSEHRWYAIQTTAGHENKVRSLIERRIKDDPRSEEEKPIRQALVPTQEVGDQERQEGDGGAQDLSGLRAREHGLESGDDPRHQRHPGRDQVRRHRATADAAPARRSEPPPRDRGSSEGRGAAGDHPVPDRPGGGDHRRAVLGVLRDGGRGDPRQREGAGGRVAVRAAHLRGTGLLTVEGALDGEGDCCNGEAPGARRAGDPRPAGRHGPGAARREHHGVRQAVQCQDGPGAGDDHAGRGDDLQGPDLHLHYQDAPGRRAPKEGSRHREGVPHLQPAEGGEGHARAAEKDRRDQAARSERERPGRRYENGGRHGSLDGAGGGGLMRVHGKHYRAAVATLEPRKLYSPREAVEKVKATAYAKFDESVDIAVRLGVDPKHADQIVRGTVSLPHGTGKKVRVLVIAQGEKAKEAEAAGADFVGIEYVQKIKDGWLDTDVIVATPDVMGQLGPLGKVLGPRGLMPNPKAGTVTMDVARAVKELKAGKIEFRVDKSGIVHAPTGKKSFAVEALEENLRAFMEAIVRARPAAAKGHYIRSITVSSTMGPGVPVDPAVFA